MTIDQALEQTNTVKKGDGAKYETVNTNHHEQTVQAQWGFLEKSGKLTRALEDMGNPFQEESSDLLSLDTN